MGGSDTAKYSPLDLVFIQDVTCSLEPYVKQAHENFRNICLCIKCTAYMPKSEDALRVGLITYRDYNEREFMRFRHLTTDHKSVTDAIKYVDVEGGDGGPKAAEAALNCALDKQMGWRNGDEAARIVVLITDAPPHGIGEEGDLYPERPPSGYENCRFKTLVEGMLRKGFQLVVIGVEPCLSTNFSTAKVFYEAMAEITFGSFFPVLNPDSLPATVIGAIMHILDERHIKEGERAKIVQSIFVENKQSRVVAEEIAENLEKTGTTILESRSIGLYQDSQEERSIIKEVKRAKDPLKLKQTLHPIRLKRVEQSPYKHDAEILFRLAEDEEFERFAAILYNSERNRTGKLIEFHVFENAREDATLRHIVLGPDADLSVRINIPYYFELQSGRDIKRFSKYFERDETRIDVATYFKPLYRRIFRTFQIL